MAENLKDKIAETFLEMTARKSFDKINEVLEMPNRKIPEQRSGSL